MRIIDVIPLNLKSSHKKYWASVHAYSAKAYLFENTNECFSKLKDILLSIKNYKQYSIFVLIKMNNIDELFKHKQIKSSISIKDGIVFELDSDSYDDMLISVLYENFGIVDRLQLFFYTTTSVTNLIHDILKISKHYKYSFDDYYKVIEQCELIISDTGDGDEFEIISRK